MARRPAASRVGRHVAAWSTLAWLACAACGGGSVTGPSAVATRSLTAALETPHFSYRFAPGDAVSPDRQAAHRAWALARLGLADAPRITYYKYRDPAQLGVAAGRVTNGFAVVERAEVHTPWTFDNHEVVHIYSAALGRPSDFFNEGIAVALQTDPFRGDVDPRFRSERLHVAVAGHRRAGRLPALAGLVETAPFRAHADQTLTYQVAGSFVLFLLDTEGIDRVRAFFAASGRGDGLDAIRSRFAAAFTRPIDEAEVAWLAALPPP